MTILLDVINGLNKFLGFLDISPKYSNRAYTLLSIIPTVYILRIVYGLWLNQNYIQLVIYSLVFIGLVYFIVLNFFYYFLDKNLKGDITQLFVKYLPDDAFNIQNEESKKKKKVFEQAAEVPVDFNEDYQLILVENIQALIEGQEITTRDLTKQEGFLIEENTLYPYYYVKQIDAGTYQLQIGKNYRELETIGTIRQTEPLRPIGLFIVGGDFVKEGVRYHEPYRLKFLAKKEEATGVTRTRRSKK
ncbi:hypothetical protein P7D85_06190 [Enterococcus hulanensis]|uniref:Uncharacterized protein n=1 Tax=Enterococcus hulanensis TaxID=2559929 RepID=A0ABU3EZJ0_9ENTE|nr:DUF6681 family protein [Enterococcus hulanensis]MDT2599356.1 hypothetical protein [Enterococcus hulanensis]MDT2608763.1 hypothetical protein [Enterococcus hulanensis]MDT2616518.1 hypothetical protein [Enterococcus hulanensis]MDT2627442.1 hypothetical protein [Enterococcus hulanensis]MDT2657308.1 hypothetical protein [Enterococcus hulanensis]